MYKKTLSTVLAIVACLSLSACNVQTGSPNPDKVITPTAEPEPLWSPSFIDVQSAEGNEVTIKKGGFIEVSTLGSENPNSWLVATDNDKIVKVGNGSPNNFANPVIEGLEKGTATITLTNGISQKTVVFSVKVDG